MDVKNYKAVETLKDGQDIIIRAVRESDKEAIAGSLGLLSDASVYRRFFTLKQSLSERELKYFTEVDFIRSVQLVVELAVKNNKLIAGCRYVAIDNNDPTQ